VLDLLTGLVDKSLVLVEGQNGNTRYRVLETIRQYAGEKLLAAGEAEAVRDRHLDWYLGLAAQAKPELIGPRQVAWLDRLERERDNLRGALEWALERGPVELALRLAAAVWRLWQVRDNPNEGREWLLRVLAMPGAGGPTRARAEVLDGACEIAMQDRGDDPAVPRLGEECLAIYRALGDRRGTAWALCHLAHYAANTGDAERAGELAAEAVALAREADAPWVVAQAVEAVGKAVHTRGDYQLARRHLEESLAIFRTLGDWRAVASGLLWLHWCSLEQGDYAASRTYGAEGLAIAHELHSKGHISSLLCGLGILTRVEGDFTRSRALVAESLDLAREVGDRALTGAMLLNIGWLARVEGDVGRAESLIKESLTSLRAIDDQAGLAAAVGFSGVLAISRGAHRRGARLLAAVVQRHVRPVWVPPHDRRAYEESIAAARTALGERAFVAAWAEGQAMTLDQAVDYALGDDDPDESLSPPHDSLG
jgi:tetratricopeptide (TPR) repeat protein